MFLEEEVIRYLKITRRKMLTRYMVHFFDEFSACNVVYDLADSCERLYFSPSYRDAAVRNELQFYEIVIAFE